MRNFNSLTILVYGYLKLDFWRVKLYHIQINDSISLSIADFTYIIRHRILYNRFSHTAHGHAVHFPRVSINTQNGRSYDIIILIITLLDYWIGFKGEKRLQTHHQITLELSGYCGYRVTRWTFGPVTFIR